jgi:hypothetical protein
MFVDASAVHPRVMMAGPTPGGGEAAERGEEKRGERRKEMRVAEAGG